MPLVNIHLKILIMLMKQICVLVCMLVGVLAAAQNTPQTAFDVIEGENHYDFPSETMEPKTAYWQVTAPSDCGRLTNLFIKSRGCSFTITDQDGTVITPVTFSLQRLRCVLRPTCRLHRNHRNPQRLIRAEYNRIRCRNHALSPKR